MAIIKILIDFYTMEQFYYYYIGKQYNIIILLGILYILYIINLT